MKKTFRILSVMALACLVVFGSCKKNEENNNNTNENGTISAGIVQPNNGAKTSITINGSEGIIKWTSGDQILVGDGSQSNTFTLTEGAGESTGTFNCSGFAVDDLEYYAAAYPASAATLSGTAVIFNIPAEQTLTRIEDGFGNGANPMVAYATAPLNELEFKSVFGGVGIKLQAPVAACITKLVITDNNNYLYGQFSVADVNVDNPQATYVSGGGHSITLNLPEGGLTVDASNTYNVYIMLPVGALSNGFTLAAYAGETKVTEKSTTLTDATISLNQLNNAVTYNVELPAGQATTAEAVKDIIEDPDYTGPVTIVGGVLDFADPVTGASYTVPADQQIVIAENAEVEISNLTATVTDASSDYPAAMIIKAGANATLNNVTVTSTSTHENTRALNVIGANTEVTLNNCTIDGGDAGYSRGLNVYDGNATVNVVGGSIHASHYAINIPSTGDGVTINLSDASIASGWAAINVWGENNTVNATNCTLEGVNDKNYNEDGWNNFGTIVFNTNNCSVVLDHCTVNAESTTGNAQWAVLPHDECTLTMRNGCTITGTHTSTTYWANGGYGASYPHYDSWTCLDDETFTYNLGNTVITWDGSDAAGVSHNGKGSATPKQFRNEQSK